MAMFRGENYRYWAFLALAIGLFTSVSDMGSVAVALPSISNHFETALPTTQWVLIGYTLTISALLLPMGRFADIAGRKRIYVIGFVIFIVAACIAGMAPNMTSLIVIRIAQGAGAAMTQGTSMAMIVASFPPQERGKALGLQMSMVGAGGVAGPAIGGFIVEVLGWQWVFFGTALLATVATIAAMVMIDSSRVGQTRGTKIRYDWIGAVLSVGALIAFLNGMTWAPSIGYGHPLVVALLVGSATLLVAFVVQELRSSSPMMDIRLFKRRLFAFGVLASFLNFLGMQSVRFLMPFYLQAVLGLSARAGWAHHRARRNWDDYHGASQRTPFRQVRLAVVYHGRVAGVGRWAADPCDSSTDLSLLARDGGYDHAEHGHRTLQCAE